MLPIIITSMARINIIGSFFQFHIWLQIAPYLICAIEKILFPEFFILLSFVLIVFPDCCKNVTHHSSRWRSLVSRVLKSVSKVSVVRPRLTLLGNFFLLNFTLGINNGLFNKRLSKRKLLESTPLFRNLESLKKCEQILP